MTKFKTGLFASGCLACWAAFTPASAQTAQGQNAQGGIETVTVTAEKRTESELDVPMAMTALSGDDLVRKQSFHFEDYVGTVPGLNLITDGYYGAQLIVRGLTTGDGSVSGSTAVYVDDIPLSSNSPFVGSAGLMPNFDAYDMARIEILKGPQGTLYGSNALGGLLKYVTNAPDPSGFAASVQAGFSSVYNGGGVGYDWHGMVNIPISDTAALRIVAYQTYTPGYIDDPGRGLKADNQEHYSGGRAGLLWQPSSDLSVKLSAIYQVRSLSDDGYVTYEGTTVGNDERNEQPVYGPLTSESAIAQPSTTMNEVGNLVVNYDFGWAHLTSSSSYAQRRSSTLFDESVFYAPYFSGYYCQIYTCSPINNPDVGLIGQFNVSQYTQEVRLASPADQTVSWQAGVFYQHQQGHEFEQLYAVDPATHHGLAGFTIDGSSDIGTYNIHPAYLEWAGFADLTWHMTPTIEASLGGRFSYNDQSYHELGTGTLGCGCDFGTPSHQDVATYSGDLKYHITPSEMVYARIAAGFVPGGPNDILNVALPSYIHPTYTSSTTTNYEIGYKASLLDDHLNIELALYDIDWHSIQLQTVVIDESTLANSGSATSEGLEWSFTYIPIAGLTLGFNGAYNEAYLTQNTVAGAGIGAFKGDSLPADPLWSGSLSADYETPVFGDYSGFGGVAFRYVGPRGIDFFPDTPRVRLPGNGIVSIRGGIENAKYSFMIYVKNLTNVIKPTYLEYNSFAYGAGPQNGDVTMPRTVGVELAAHF